MEGLLVYATVVSASVAPVEETAGLRVESPTGQVIEITEVEQAWHLAESAGGDRGV